VYELVVGKRDVAFTGIESRSFSLFLFLFYFFYFPFFPFFLFFLFFLFLNNNI